MPFPIGKWFLINVLKVLNQPTVYHFSGNWLEQFLNRKSSGKWKIDLLRWPVSVGLLF